MSDKKTNTDHIIGKEMELTALRWSAPLVGAHFALLGVNIDAGIGRSCGTRMCQTLFPVIANGEAKLMGSRGTSGATGRWQALLGLRSSDLNAKEREEQLIALLIARAMPNIRMTMGAHMLSGLPSAELSRLCKATLGDKPGLAFANIVKAVEKFVSVSTTLVKADMKRKAGKTQNLSASASDAITEARNAQGTQILAMLLEAQKASE